MKILTTTIRRGPFADIIAGVKKIEYRELKPYWTKRLKEYEVPFDLRLINGMSKKPPELTVVVRKILVNKKERIYELHLGRVSKVKNWSVSTSIVDVIPVRGVRGYKVVEMTKAYVATFKNKTIGKIQKTANVDADFKKINAKISAHVEKHGKQ